MRRMLAVFNTNQVNRYGMVFPASTLESALSQAWNEVRPTYLSHDVHQPIGLSRPVCLYVDLSGELRIKRHFVPSESLHIGSKDGVREITYQVTLPEGVEQEAMKAGAVEIAPAWLLRTSTCSRCDGPYEDCQCSKFLDESVHQIVMSADPLGAVWTDRSALSGVSKSTKQASSPGIPTEE